MKILILPNAFKGSLSAVKTARILKNALKKKHAVRAYPISDGGDGFIDFFSALYPAARKIPVTAKNAFLKQKRTSFLMLPDAKTAVIETARICGLGNTPAAELDPLGASSFGVGEVILKAIEKGAKTIYVGLGGVACNDGGAGMAAACGAILSDKKGKTLSLGAIPLLQIKNLDLTPLEKKIKPVQIYAVADVTNTLLGPHSSAKVFGPQKGASAEQVKLLDQAMSRWAKAILKASGRNTAHVPSTAAAGAIAAGLYGCFGAKLLLGADFLFQKAKLEPLFNWADLIITSEGKLDRQTFYGKAPLAVLKLAKKYKKPVLFICGDLDKKGLQRQNYLPSQLAVLTDYATGKSDSIRNASHYLKKICQSI